MFKNLGEMEVFTQKHNLSNLTQKWKTEKLFMYKKFCYNYKKKKHWKENFRP